MIFESTFDHLLVGISKKGKPDIQIVEKREAPLLGNRVTESEDHAKWLQKKLAKIKFWFGRAL